MTCSKGRLLLGVVLASGLVLAAASAHSAGKDAKSGAGAKPKKPTTSAVEAKDAKDAKESKAAKDGKDAKGTKDAKDGKDAKGSKDVKEGRGGKSAKETSEPETVPGHPNLKIRQGSYLRKNEGDPEAIDLRGELERRRDFEMRRHYARMAELDAIEEVAVQESDDALMERVEAVRRKEERRFWSVMQTLKGLAWQKIVRGEP